MKAGLRLSRLLLPAAIGALLSVFTGQAWAQEPATTTYKSTTIERVTTTREETRVETPVRKEKPVCVLFIKNRAANVPEAKIGVLQDFVAAHVTEAGFVLVGREAVMNSAKALAAPGPNAGQNARQDADVDTILSTDASAMQLARNLGADAILNLSISSYGTDRISYTGHNLNVTSVNYRLKVTYELLDILRGGTHSAGVVTVSFTDRKQEGLESNRENVLDDLLDGAAADTAGMLASAMRNGGTAGLTEAAKEARKQATFTLVTTVADFPVPQIVRDASGQYMVGQASQLIEVPVANIELDENSVGLKNGALQAAAGLHKLRLQHELFKDWEGTVFISDGGRLSLAMQLDESGRARFKDVMSFYAGLKQGQVLTDATVQELLGKAKVLEQSGLKVNVTALPSH